MILVTGDAMVDRYWFGTVTRISPEAPVPVLAYGRMEEREGGAANVARNASALGAQVTLLSVTGDDEAGAALAKLMDDHRISTSFYRDRSISTTLKLRVIGLQQQLLRVDFENEPDHEILAAKLAEFRNLLVHHDAVILSDYGKGGLTHAAEMVRLTKEAAKPIYIDPKGSDYTKYAGATAITPNRTELAAVIGRWRAETDLISRTEELRDALGLEAILVTRSEEGMTLLRKGLVVHDPARAREVFDVSGAGDTVIATLATALAAGCNWDDAIRISNLAAGIVVGKLGTAVATRDELAALIE